MRISVPYASNACSETPVVSGIRRLSMQSVCACVRMHASLWSAASLYREKLVWRDTYAHTHTRARSRDRSSSSLPFSPLSFSTISLLSLFLYSFLYLYSISLSSLFPVSDLYFPSFSPYKRPHDISLSVRHTRPPTKPPFVLVARYMRTFIRVLRGLTDELYKVVLP